MRPRLFAHDRMYQRLRARKTLRFRQVEWDPKYGSALRLRAREEGRTVTVEKKRTRVVVSLARRKAA